MNTQYHAMKIVTKLLIGTIFCLSTLAYAQVLPEGRFQGVDVLQMDEPLSAKFDDTSQIVVNDVFFKFIGLKSAYTHHAIGKDFNITARVINEKPHDFLTTLSMVGCQNYHKITPDYVIVDTLNDVDAWKDCTYPKASDQEDERLRHLLASKPVDDKQIQAFAHLDVMTWMTHHLGVNMVYRKRSFGNLNDTQYNGKNIHAVFMAELDKHCLTHRFINDNFVVLVPLNTCQPHY